MGYMAVAKSKKALEAQKNSAERIDNEINKFPDSNHKKKLKSFKDDYKKIMDYLKNTVTFRSFNW